MKQFSILIFSGGILLSSALQAISALQAGCETVIAAVEKGIVLEAKPAGPFKEGAPENLGLKSKLLGEQEELLATATTKLVEKKESLEFQDFIRTSKSPLIASLVSQTLPVNELNSDQKQELERIAGASGIAKSVSKQILKCVVRRKPSPKKLEETEIDKMSKAVAREKATVAELGEKVAKLREEEKPHLLTWAAEHMRTDPEFKATTEDILRAYSLLFPEDSPERKQIASLVVGGNAKPEAVLKLARHFKNSGYKVFFDADSPLAEPIAKELGIAGIGITANPKLTRLHSSPVYAIENPHARMQVLAQAENTIVSADSLTGMGILLLKKNAVSVLDPKDNWSDPLTKWVAGLDKQKLNQGLNYKSAPKVDMTANLADTYASVKPLPESSFRIKPLADLGYEALFDTLSHTVTMNGGKREMPRVGGAVYYGSAGFGKYDPLTQSVASGLSRRGVPAVTGGAGGSMLIVNHTAFAAGADSIGIPIGGKHKLSTETVTYSDYHTTTIPASSYDSRVPLLGLNRELVVINPGGMGTAREVATTLFNWAANPNSKQPLLFVGSEYYQPLVNELKKGNLPSDVAGRIAVVDSAADADSQVNKWIRDGRINISNFQTPTPPQERNIKPLEPKDLK